MKKKLLAFVTVCAMCLGILSGCSGSAGSASSPAGGTASTVKKVNGIDISKPYEATMVLIGNQQSDQAKVLEQVNKILMRDINTKLNVVMLSTGDFTTQLPLMLQGGDKVDLVPVISGFANSFISNKMILNLNDYVKNNGTDIKKAFEPIGEDLINTGTIGDFMYGVPVAHGNSGVSTVCMREDWLKEAGYSVKDINSVDDMDKIYEKVKAKHSGAVMMWMTKGTTPDSGYETSDPLTDYNGVLLNYGAQSKVVNWFSSDDYKQLVTRHYKWAQKGWISKDAATTTDSASTAVRAGRAFSFYTPGGPDAETVNSVSCNTKMVTATITKAHLNTTNFGYVSWGIAKASENSERAFLLLDYLYKSGEVTDLLNYGIKDVHYVVGSDGLYSYPTGVNISNSSYSVNQTWQFPNNFISGVWKGNDPKIWSILTDETKKAQKSIALGFAYSAGSLSTELSAITNVKNQYLDALNTGSVNPAVELPKFISALDQAGMQKVIAEKQNQLNSWMAKKGK